MCLIFGLDERRKPTPGYEHVNNCQCYNCGNYKGHVVTTKPWFSLFYVPVIPLSIHGDKVVRCTVCGFEQPLNSRNDISAHGGQRPSQGHHEHNQYQSQPQPQQPQQPQQPKHSQHGQERWA